MAKSGKALEQAIDGLGIKKAQFGLLANRTPVCVSGYISGRMPIPDWIWLVVDDAKKMSKKALQQKINRLSKTAQNA